FGHEVHATEDNVLSSRARRLLRELVRVAAVIGEADHLIALIVVAQNHAFAPQSLTGGSDALVHSVIGENEIIFQTANSGRGSHFVSRLQLRNSVQRQMFSPASFAQVQNGDVESFQRLQRAHYPSSLLPNQG